MRIIFKLFTLFPLNESLFDHFTCICSFFFRISWLLFSVMSDNNSREDSNNTHQHQHDPQNFGNLGNLQNQNLQTPEINTVTNDFHEFNQQQIQTTSSLQHRTSVQPAVAPSIQPQSDGGQHQVLSNSSTPHIHPVVGQFVNQPLTQPNYPTNPAQAGSNSSNFLQNAPKFSEFLIVSAPVPAIIDEQRDLVEITRVENPAYKINNAGFEQSHQQYQQQLQEVFENLDKWIKWRSF